MSIAAKKDARNLVKPIKGVHRSSKPAGNVPKPNVYSNEVGEDGLTFRQRSFADNYVVFRNGTKAAIEAGYEASSARQQASRLLTNTNIRTAISKANQELKQQLVYDSDDLFLSLVEDLEADVSDLFDGDGCLLPSGEWPTAFRRGLVQGVTVSEIWDGAGKDRTQIGEMKTIKLADRSKIKEMLGKHVRVQAFNEKRTLDIPQDSPLAMLVAQIANTPLVPTEDGDDK